MRIDPPTFTMPRTNDAPPASLDPDTFTASRWLREANATASQRDVLDALRDAETLVELCRARARAAGINC
jgi:hypothetical protein